MPAIAKTSGITAGAIYKHFKSKGELLLEVVKRSFESTPLFMQNSAAANGYSPATACGGVHRTGIETGSPAFDRGSFGREQRFRGQARVGAFR